MKFRTLILFAALAVSAAAQSFPVKTDASGSITEPSNIVVSGAQGGTGVANTGKTLTLGGNLTTSGAFNVTLTATANSTVTIPTTGVILNQTAIAAAYQPLRVPASLTGTSFGRFIADPVRADVFQLSSNFDGTNQDDNTKPSWYFSFDSRTAGDQFQVSRAAPGAAVVPLLSVNSSGSLIANPLHTASRRMEVQIPHTVSTENYLRVSSNSTTRYGAEFGYGLTAGGSPQIRINRVHADTVTPWLTVATLDGAASMTGSLGVTGNVTTSGTNGFMRLKSVNGTTASPVEDGIARWSNTNGLLSEAGLYAVNTLTDNSQVFLRFKALNTAGTPINVADFTSSGLTIPGNVSITGGSSLLSIANNGVGLSVGTTRPFTYNGSGVASIRGESGNWAVRYGFAGSAGTALGGFGAYGTNDALGYLWLGTDHATTFARFDTAAAHFSVPTISQASSSVGLFRMDRSGVRQWNLTNDGNMVWSTGDGAGSFTFSNSGGVRFTGTNTNDNAATGYVGEYLSSTASGISLTTATDANITSISLTAGDWDVEGTIAFAPSASPTLILASISSTSATASATMDGTTYHQSTAFPAGSTQQINSGSRRFSLSATTTIYLVGRASFSSGTCLANGVIRARRAR